MRNGISSHANTLLLLLVQCRDEYITSCSYSCIGGKWQEGT